MGAGRDLGFLRACAPRADAGVGCRRRAGEQLASSDRFGATILPGLELADGVPPSLRTMVVMPDAADVARRDRGAGRALGGPSSGESATAISASRCFRTGRIPPPRLRPDDDELLDAAADGNRALESAIRAGAGRRPVPPAASPAAVERGAAKVDRLGAQARQAARAQSVAARRHRHDFRDRSTVARRSCRPTSATSSRSTPTRGCRGARPRRLIGKMAHPLNRPTLDPAHQTGHRRTRRASAARHAIDADRPGGLALSSASFRAPAVWIPTPSRFRTCIRICSAKAPTPARASTMWMSSRRRSTARIPENTLLSHDLFEGIFARAGLVSDIEVVEEFPSRYDVAAARQHRWARGDWQLLPWIFGRRRPSKGDRRHRASRSIGRWKMIDNLRRSLSAPASFYRLAGGLDPAVRRRGAAGPVSSSRPSRSRRFSPSSSASRRGDAGISRRSRFRAVGADLEAALS